MFDISFSELMVIGVIALIVLGPERMPKVARTIGHLLGRAQRYVNEVKSDIQKEMDLKEIGDIKHQMEDAARSVQSSMAESAQEFKSAVEAPTAALKDSLTEAREALATKPADPATATSTPEASTPGAAQALTSPQAPELATSPVAESAPAAGTPAPSTPEPAAPAVPSPRSPA